MDPTTTNITRHLKQLTKELNKILPTPITITITETKPPKPKPPRQPPNTPTRLMQQISQYLQDCDGEPLSGRQIEKAITGKSDRIRQALKTLHQHDYVTRTETRSGWYTYTHHRPYQPPKENQ